MLSFVFSEGAAAFGSTFLLDGFNPLGDVVSGIANIGSSLINAHASNKNTKRMIAAQSEENEKAYRRNVEMWERENNYNTPTAVVQRLRDAGMNPALAYGIPNVSSPAPSAPVTDMSAMAGFKSPLAGALEAGVNSRYMNAMISNINAQTKKTNEEANKANAETSAQLTYNEYQDLILTGNISEQNSRIELNASQTDLNDMRSRESYSNISKILAETNVLKSNLDKLAIEMEGMKEDNAIKRIEKEMRRDVLKSQMSHLYAQAKLAGVTAAKTQEEFNQLSAAGIYNLLMKKESANNAMLQGMLYQYQGDELSLKIDEQAFKNRKLSEREFLDDVNAMSKTFSNVVGTLGGFFVGR